MNLDSVAKFSLIAVLFLLLAACSNSKAAAPEVEIDLAAIDVGGTAKTIIAVERDNLFPEGIEYNPLNGQFLLSSLTEGAVFSIQEDGSYRPLVKDQALVASLGLEVDAGRNRLLVASGETRAGDDPNIKPQAALGIYNLTTGERLHFVDLIAVAPEGKHVANDIAIDTAGNAYITDSAAPLLYKVDPEGNASIFAGVDLFKGSRGNLNGIVYHPAGYLLIAKPRDGVLLKMPVDNPESVAQVKLDQPILGADGLIWHPNGRLIVVSGRLSLVLSLKSDDDWSSARIEKAVKTDQQATTAAIRNEDVFVIYGHLDQFGVSGGSTQNFEIAQIEFEN
jgi:sugar lactone lactonase YvrE